MIQKYDFTAYKGPVSSSDFVGRKEDIDRCLRVLELHRSLLLVGLRRIGKTSLALKLMATLASQKRDWETCRIDLGEVRKEIKSIDAFFNRVVYKTVNDFPVFKKFFFKVWFYFMHRHESGKQLLEYFIQRFFPRKWFLIVIDEFDTIRNWPDLDEAACFIQCIRGITQRAALESPEIKVVFLICMARTPGMMEIRASGNVSGFGDSIEAHTLHPFSKDDFHDMLLHSVAEVPVEYEDQLIKMTGLHPYLTAIFLAKYNAVFLQDPGVSSADAFCRAIDDSYGEYVQYYKRIKQLLSEIDPKLYQCFCYWTVYHTAKDFSNQMTDVLRYGLCIRDESNVPQCFSEHYRQYLLNENLSCPIWEILGRTENRLRRLIENFLKQEIGEDRWFEEGCSDCFSEKDLEEIAKRQREAKRVLHLAEERSPLDYIYLCHLGKIISDHWERFKKILGGEKDVSRKSYTSLIGNELLRVARNTEGHFNPLPPLQKLQTEEICRKLNDLLDGCGVSEDGTRWVERLNIEQRPN